MNAPIRWLLLNASQVFTIAGLVSDMTGAFFVATEVVNQFRGKQMGGGYVISSFTTGPRETDEYRKWNEDKLRKMKIGLVFLMVGFVFQLIGSFLQLRTD